MISNPPPTRRDSPVPHRLLVGGAGLAALLSASCCVVPIGLSILGLGGSWLAVLGPFVAWRTEILLVVGAILAFGWVSFWRRRRCARRNRSAPVLLGLATLALVLAVSAPLWEADATRTMMALWRGARS
ncbi:MAG: hypothetical protein ACWA5A_17855 [Marinibacterium sp.]